MEEAEPKVVCTSVVDYFSHTTFDFQEENFLGTIQELLSKISYNTKKLQ